MDSNRHNLRHNVLTNNCSQLSYLDYNCCKKVFTSPTYIIIANLALTDWLTGCISFPCNIAICILAITGRNPCKIASVVIPPGYILSIATLLTITFQAVERYVAIFYPFQYKARVTNSVVIIINVAIWIISCTSVLLSVLSSYPTVFLVLKSTGILLFSSLDIFIYLKIYLETKKIEGQIATHAQVPCNDETSTFKPESNSKVTRVTVMILVNVILCYTPVALCYLYGLYVKDTSYQSQYVLYWSLMLAVLNSFTNPIISCLQLSVIRKAVFSRNKRTTGKSCYSTSAAASLNLRLKKKKNQTNKKCST